MNRFYQCTGVWGRCFVWNFKGRYFESLDCLLSRLFRCRSKTTSKLRVTGLCEGNPPVTGVFPSQRASNAENVYIWWRHHDGYVIYRSSSPEVTDSNYARPSGQKPHMMTLTWTMGIVIIQSVLRFCYVNMVHLTPWHDDMGKEYSVGCRLPIRPIT